MSGKDNSRIRHPLGWYGIGLLFWCAGCLADVPITVKATLVKPACYIMAGMGEWTEGLHDDLLAVDFGEVPIADLGTANAAKNINLWFTCVKDNPSKTLNIYVKPTSYGVISTLGGHVLATSKENLGIAILVDSNPVTLNQWVPVSQWLQQGDGIADAKLILTAQLVAQGDKNELEGGYFQASANVILHYL
ncbi:P pilus assembly protein, pilin FimA [Serratia rubidaea]|nr:fimbrial protein [Serratia rubidaea]SQJ07812.1 P pilus assembly protein, pilin FimA [Serratia rubidaea]